MSLTLVSTRGVCCGVSARARGARGLRAASLPCVPASRGRGAPAAAMASGLDQVAAAVTASLPPSVFELAADANDLVNGCGVNGTCGQVDAPPFALIGSALAIGGGVLAFVTFGLKGGADAALEMQERDSDFFGKK